MIKYTRHEQESFNLQEALAVMLNILSYLNDVMHSTQIVGYPVIRKEKTTLESVISLPGSFQYIRSNTFACRKLFNIQRKTSWNGLYSNQNQHPRSVLIRTGDSTMQEERGRKWQICAISIQRIDQSKIISPWDITELSPPR